MGKNEERSAKITPPPKPLKPSTHENNKVILKNDKIYIVYVELDSCDSGCAPDLSLSAVFNDYEKAKTYYDNTIKEQYINEKTTDLINLSEAEFHDGKLVETKIIKKMGWTPSGK